jgi:hypothetical protein
MNSNQTSSNKNQKNVTSRKRKRNRRKKNRGGAVVARGSNNPLTQNGIRGPIGQTLSTVQFTATSPLNLFDVARGSTPGGIRVKGRELIGSVTLSATSTGAFQLANVASFAFVALNPVSFPRLAAYDPIYEYFKFHSATCILQSNQPTTSSGEWLICSDYDINDAVPTTSTGMMRNISSAMANIYSDMSMVVTGSLSRLPKFLSGTSEGTPDQSYQAAIYVGIEGYSGTTGAAVGYLIIEYDVEFFTPQ